jgi:MtN3 and saliva related transmembrane protein
MTEFLAVAATGWGIAMAASPLLQIRRMRTTGSSADLSIGYLSVLQVGFVLWLAYGLTLGNPALIVSNSAALCFGLLTIAIARRMHRRMIDGGDSAAMDPDPVVPR